jgi:ethanolamine ammonia-lyase small subunit
MTTTRTLPVTPSPWTALRAHTRARVALGRAGHSLATADHLALAVAQAQARDAVHLALDTTALCQGLHDAGLQALALHSAAPDRTTYLQRPDLGRQLDAVSRRALAAQTHPAADLAFAVIDGLSALALHRHVLDLIDATLALLRRPGELAWRLAPVAVVEQGRVALGDEIGAGLNAGIVVVLIGERPGLSSPDSLGVYITHAPRPGRTDAERNCISNIRPEGLQVADAAAKLHWLLCQARQHQRTGIGLKDEQPGPGLGPPDDPQTGPKACNFLLPAP